MANALSSLLAEILTDSKESRVVEHIISKKMIYWYIDYVTVCFEGINKQLNGLLECINNVRRNITFAIELEQDN